MRKIMLAWLVSALVWAPMALAEASPATQPATDSAGQAPEQLLNQLLKPPVVAKPLAPVLDAPRTDRNSGKGAIAPGTPAVALQREGTFVFDRAGRLSHSADGSRAEFKFEADGKTLNDPPVIILPNIKLMIMEDAVKNTNRDLRFKVTGMLTEYRGRNYILLERVTVPSDSTQQF